ncbi:MAG: MFS transporter, partial [Nocardioides sp.]
RMIGPALAGLLIAAGGSGVEATGWVILANAVSYLAVIGSLQRLDPARLSPAPVMGSRKGAVRDGVRYVRARPDLVLVLSIVFAVGTFGLNFQMTSALMATEVFGRGPTEYGLLGTFLAVGSLAGSLMAARRPHVRHRLVVGAAVAFGALEMVAGLAPSYLTFALLCPLLGLAALTMITSANAHLQLHTDPVMRGRVMALYMMIFIGGTPLGAPLIGWVGETWGARWTLLVGGAATVAGTLLSAALFLGLRRVLTALRAPGSLIPRVWDDQAVARARK